jgi:hypothetical protein
MKLEDLTLIRVASSQKIKKGQIWPQAASKKAKFSIVRKDPRKAKISKENFPKYIK